MLCVFPQALWWVLMTSCLVLNSDKSLYLLKFLTLYKEGAVETSRSTPWICNKHFTWPYLQYTFFLKPSPVVCFDTRLYFLIVWENDWIPLGIAEPYWNQNKHLQKASNLLVSQLSRRQMALETMYGMLLQKDKSHLRFQFSGPSVYPSTVTPPSRQGPEVVEKDNFSPEGFC